MSKQDINLKTEEDDNKTMTSNQSALVSWVMQRVSDWEDYRDSNFKARWDEYYRLWRGIWTEEDKTRDSERSRLIAPASQQAVDSTVSELEEAAFGRGKWIDIEDDIADQQKDDFLKVRDYLLEDFDTANIPQAVVETFLNGAIYGTGISKVWVDQIEQKKPASRPVEGNPDLMQIGHESIDKVLVKLEAIHPEQFVIEPKARTVAEALGCATITIKPLHDIVRKQQDGTYNDFDIGSMESTEDVASKGEVREKDSTNNVRVVEYYGLVPACYLREEEGDAYDSEDEYEDMVEAIVTIANDSVLLRGIANPYLMGDRPIIAYQHDTVPNRFWGRGVMEKGYSPQKALDAELRARIDALALTTHPMLAADAGRIPRGMKLEVKAGKMILTNGPPSEVLMPFNFGQLSTVTFKEAGEFERMIQMATGAMDSASPVGVSPRNATASGMSMMQSASIKRSKRTMQNIERNYLVHLITKTLWRYMQYNPQRYPINDYKFRPHSTMGIMAREFEQQQLTGLLSVVPPESPPYYILLKSIYNNSSMSDKEDMLKAIDQMMQPNQGQQQQQQLALTKLQKEIEELDAIAYMDRCLGEAALAKVSLEDKSQSIDAITMQSDAALAQQQQSHDQAMQQQQQGHEQSMQQQQQDHEQQLAQMQASQATAQ